MMHVKSFCTRSLPLPCAAWQVCIRFLRLQSSTPKSQTITSLLHNSFIKYDLKYFNPLILGLIIMGYNSRKSYIKPDN